MSNNKKAIAPEAGLTADLDFVSFEVYFYTRMLGMEKHFIGINIYLPITISFQDKQHYCWHVQFLFPSNKLGKNKLLYTTISAIFV